MLRESTSIYKLSGVSALTDAQLLSLLGIDQTSIIDTMALTTTQVRALDITLARKAKLDALKEVLRRYNETPPTKLDYIQSSKDAYKCLKHLANLNHEEVWVIYLNKANRVLLVEQLSIGGLASTIMDKMLIIKKAIDLLASGIIVAHNHPSGNENAGAQDVRVTKELIQACKLLDISLLDHLIITKSGYTSMADEGMM